MRRSLGGRAWDHDGVDRTLAERYAPPPAWRRTTTIAATVLLAAVALAWLAWAAVEQGTPKIDSTLVGWRVVDDHNVATQIDVSIDDGVSHPSCTVEALATDHTIVGELRFTPVAGTNRVTVRTQRRATSVSLPGCVADGQDAPR